MGTENHTKRSKIKPPQFPNSSPTTTTTKTTRTSSKSSRKPLSDCTNQTLTPLSLTKSKPPLPSNNPKPTTPPPPPPRNPNSVPGNDLEVSEPRTVYGRRQTAETRKSKGKDLAVSMTASPAKRNHMSRGNTTGKRYVAVSKSCPVPNKKKRHSLLSKEESSNHVLQEYIRQQQSYFAEIDAFELPEEEVASVKDLD